MHTTGEDVKSGLHEAFYDLFQCAHQSFLHSHRLALKWSLLPPPPSIVVPLVQQTPHNRGCHAGHSKKRALLIYFTEVCCCHEENNDSVYKAQFITLVLA